MLGLAVGPADAVWLSGEDRLAFLERMSTNRLTDLAVGRGRATAVLTDIGRVVDLVACYAGEEGALLITSGRGAADAVAGHLRRYILYNDRVRATSAADQVVVLRLWAGAFAASDDSILTMDLIRILAGATGIRLPADPADTAGGWFTGGTAEAPVWVLGHVPHAGLGGVDVVVPAAAAAEMRRRIEAAAASSGAALHIATPDDYAAARIRHLLPAFGAEIDGSTNPLELELKDVVDFGKGCYIGQEVVARLDSYDKVQRRLIRREIDGPVAAGDAWVVEDSTAPARGRHQGRVTTAVPLAGGAGRWQVLALVPSIRP